VSDYPGGQFISVAGQANVTAGRDVNNYYMPMSEWTGLDEEVLHAYRAQAFESYTQARRRQKWNAPFLFLIILAIMLLGSFVYFLNEIIAIFGGGIAALSKPGVFVPELIFVTALVLSIYVAKSMHLKIRREASEQVVVAAKAIREIDVELRRINFGRDRL
jgi:hypothetical protein